MNDPVLIKIAWAIGVVIAYGLLRWRLMAATHEFRVQAGREADRLAADPRVPPETQAMLTRLADKAYGFFTPWLVLLALIVAMTFPLRESRRTGIADDGEIAADVVEVKRKLVVALITASPLACALAAVVLTIGLLLRGSVEALARSVAAAGNRVFAGAARSSRPA